MKVLLIEDDKKIATIVKRGLEAEGFTVEVTFNGKDGLWLAQEGSYDLIILDIMLPGRNGYQVCADLRESGDWTPILMLTAKDGDLDEAEALDTGADDYLTKPFSFAVLVARIRALLRRAGGHPPVPVEVGDLKIDPAQRRVWRKDVEVELTARQFDVLEFLVRRDGQVLSKSDILSGVWDYDFEGDPNIVEVYIRRLRTKIDEPFGRNSIETIRGAGYRLVANGCGPRARQIYPRFGMGRFTDQEREYASGSRGPRDLWRPGLLLRKREIDGHVWRHLGSQDIDITGDGELSDEDDWKPCPTSGHAGSTEVLLTISDTDTSSHVMAVAVGDLYR